jgi:hypothetical protein
MVMEGKGGAYIGRDDLRVGADINNHQPASRYLIVSNEGGTREQQSNAARRHDYQLELEAY